MTASINGHDELSPSNKTSMTQTPSMSPPPPMALTASDGSGASGENQKGISRMVFFLLISALLGILLGELLGTFLIAGSNHQLWLEQEAIARLGYIAVPGQFLAAEMKAMSTYLAGGIFFALSLGLGYGFFCGFILWISSLYKRKWYRQVRLLPVIVLAAILAWQGKGSDPMVLLFLLTVPLVLYFLSFPLLSKTSIRLAELGSYGFLFLTFAVLLVVTFKQLDFIQIRDRLLLPTKVGRQIDEFYYRYTLYPARLVQPLCYRLQNVVALDVKGFPDDRLSEIRNIQTVLRQYDWFTATSAESPALSLQDAGSTADQGGSFQTILAHGDGDEQGVTQGVTRQGNIHNDMDEIVFYRNENARRHSFWPKDNGRKANQKPTYQKPTYRVSYREFMQEPSEHLEKYSLAADPFTLLSKGCGISLFLIVPFALALGLFVFCVWGILKVLSLIGVKKRKSGGTPLPLFRGRIKETGIILGIILMLFLALNVWLKTKSQVPTERNGISHRQKLWQLAKGDEPGDRIGALQRLDETLEAQACQAHQEDIALLARDPDPVVRRYAAQLLGKFAGLAGQDGSTGPTGPTGPDHDKNSAFPLLLSLLEDSNINVVYTAAESLGEIHSAQARDILLGILQSNRPWYLKMKVYKALKDDGWINEPKAR